MWFGTTSTTIPSPRACSAATIASNPARPPASSLSRVWSSTSYPWVEPGAACSTGDRYAWLTPRSAR